MSDKGNHSKLVGDRSPSQDKCLELVCQCQQRISNHCILVTNPTLSTLITELGKECTQVVALTKQLQLPYLQPKQQAKILADLLAATVHLHAHCDSKFQSLIAEEMEELPDDDEED